MYSYYYAHTHYILIHHEWTQAATQVDTHTHTELTTKHKVSSERAAVEGSLPQLKHAPQDVCGASVDLCDDLDEGQLLAKLLKTATELRREEATHCRLCTLTRRIAQNAVGRRVAIHQPILTKMFFKLLTVRHVTLVLKVVQYLWIVVAMAIEDEDLGFTGNDV